tara:strand:+ start:6706 stop:6954 length:249 start_codon:yes stop_codon:yes gene_type:complete
MPLYDFQNKETGEVVEYNISISEYDNFIKDNPDLKRVILKAPGLTSSGGQGALQRAGDGWKEVQDKVKAGLPPSLRDNIKTK